MGNFPEQNFTAKASCKKILQPYIVVELNYKVFPNTHLQEINIDTVESFQLLIFEKSYQMQRQNLQSASIAVCCCVGFVPKFMNSVKFVKSIQTTL